jgi:hypothetical protein
MEAAVFVQPTLRLQNRNWANRQNLKILYIFHNQLTLNVWWLNISDDILNESDEEWIA